MSFEAYISNIHAKTGKAPRDFYDEAVGQGVLRPDTKTMEFVNWLKASSGLGHGHAMAVWEAFRRSGWVPMSGTMPTSTGVRRAAAKPSTESSRR
jgi:uncharacterized protein YcnI